MRFTFEVWWDMHRILWFAGALDLHRATKIVKALWEKMLEIKYIQWMRKLDHTGIHALFIGISSESPVTSFIANIKNRLFLHLGTISR